MTGAGRHSRMKDLMDPFVLHNEEIRALPEVALSPGQAGLLSGWGVFSTLRVVHGVPFAFERHWSRMREDARLLRVPFPEHGERVRSRLLQLIEANRAYDAALRIAVVRNHGGFWSAPVAREFDLLAFTAPVREPPAGVRLALRPKGRCAESAFRGVKSIAWGPNLAILEEAHASGFDEVLLLNERGEVSECLSANVFATSGSEVWTPPLESGCLAGVTREVLLSDVRVEGVLFREKTLFPRDLERAAEVFITSTTRGLLPVVSIGGRPLECRSGLLPSLQRAYQQVIDNYIRKQEAV
jgi:branched-chain amino acid aminotransferase